MNTVHTISLNENAGVKGHCSYSAASSLLNHLNHFTLVFTSGTADMFIPTPTQFLWEAVHYTTITARRLSTHMFTHGL